MRDTTCPECRNVCKEHPRRDFALRHILPTIYSGLGREMPTFEGLNATLFARIYVMVEESQQLTLPAELDAFWYPMLAEVRGMRGVEMPPTRAIPGPVIDVDVEMEGDDTDSDFELGSGVDSEGNASGASGSQGAEVA